MTSTRPDLSFIVMKLSQYMSNVQFNMAKHVLRYLKGTLEQKLTFRKSKEGINLHAVCDADWRSSEDWKSTQGMYGLVISWKSRKQPTVTLSTCEAECMSLASAIQEAEFLRQLLEELIGKNIAKATDIYHLSLQKSCPTSAFQIGHCLIAKKC